jgi:small subunit ribosomal protein S2
MINSLNVELTDLLEAGCHFGHQARRWNPNMKKYIYTERDGVHIFDLTKTKTGLEAACEYIYDLAKRGGQLLMIGTKRQAKPIVKEESINAGLPYVTERWLGGTITNWDEIKKRIDKLMEMRQKLEAGEYKKYTKKENVLLKREIARLERFFGGLTGLTKLPEAVFIVDVQRETTAVTEARMAKIKIVALVDSNADPDKVDYVIPANDDAVRSIKLLVSAIAKAYVEGREVSKKKQEPTNKTKQREEPKGKKVSHDTSYKKRK